MSTSVWNRRMESMYRYLFRGQCLLGNWPLHYDQAESRVIYSGRRNGGGSFVLFLLNCCLYPLFFLKHVLLLLNCYINGNYETGFELLIFWALGSFFFLTAFLNQVYYRKEIPTVISAWLRFEKCAQGKNLLYTFWYIHTVVFDATVTWRLLSSKLYRFRN